MKIQSVSDLITNSSTEIFLVRDLEREPRLDVPEILKREILEHARIHRCPFAEWYMKEHPEALTGYNKSNADPDRLIKVITLYDAFVQYVLETKKLGTTPSLKTRTSKPWCQVTVDEVLEALKEDKELVYPNATPLDESSVLVEVDRDDLDVTKEAMKEIYNLAEYHDMPFWLSFMDQALIDYQQKHGGIPEERQKVFDWCKETFQKWKEDKLKNVKD